MKVGRSSGFTLFEILITLSIISIVVGAGFFTIARSTKERALERAADTLHSMVRIARTQAITNGVHARLIINNDSTDTASYLRRLGVVIEDEEDGHWRAVERGALLPEGVFVVPQSGDSVVVPSGLPRSIYRKINSDTAEAVYTFDYPLKDKVDELTEGKPSWICVQFAPNGRLSSVNWGGGGLVPLSNQLILAKGNRSAGAIEFLDPKAFYGIAFKRGGSSYRSNESELFEVEEEEEEYAEESS